MMDKERLEEIKRNYNEMQAQNLRLQERVHELEKDVKEWETVNELWEEVNENLAIQNKRYREAILLAVYELGFALDETEIGETKERILQAKLILRNANVLEEMK